MIHYKTFTGVTIIVGTEKEFLSEVCERRKSQNAPVHVYETNPSLKEVLNSMGVEAVCNLSALHRLVYCQGAHVFLDMRGLYRKATRVISGGYSAKSCNVLVGKEEFLKLLGIPGCLKRSTKELDSYLYYE